MSIQRERGPYYDLAAIAAHDMVLEEAGEDFCFDYRICHICQDRLAEAQDCDAVSNGRVDWRDSHG